MKSNNIKMIPLKRICKLEYGESLDSARRNEEGTIPVYGSNGIVGFHERAITCGPTIIVGRKGSFGKIVYSETPCFPIDTTYFIDQRHTKHDLKWLYYLLQTLELDVYSQDTGVPGLSREYAYNKICSLVPIEEQRLITLYLDQQTAKLDQLIEKKQRLIDLLQEKRQALITEAVTKGLNPNVALKDSGIEWLGQIPEHWNIVRLKFIAKVRSGVTKGRNLSDRETVELPYLRVANVQDGYLDLSEVTTISVMPHEVERYSLRNGDVLMNEGGDFDKLGRGTRWNGEIDPCLHQNHVFAVRPKDINYSDWINLYTSSEPAKRYFIMKSKQTTNLASISSSNIKELQLPFPDKKERDEIIKFVSVHTERLDRLVSLIEKQVDVIREYRQALITVAVTGQIDVREKMVVSTDPMLAGKE
ncbi:restriction endonuclease subunit S [Paenibacillus naphthalenovorans]|uniref:restriction endonuclease subunit S n=1 Tax=Paenibacillus naphthalenovorans TaxID=162209 RepID=UPI000889A2E7|nr:restriction endonuclease subunit S [Paenibacillus naphthalenovorans]SDJ82735.1 type I restriction enzyme, S subunit [Paenibacillus naphthalenovorans]